MPEQLPDQTHVTDPNATQVTAPTIPSVDSYLGKVIDGKYRIISKLGAGGMGAVFKAEHSLMGRFVALKVLHPHLVENEDLMKRFQHEAKIASKLNHPNAITTYDFGIYQGAPYLVMEFVEGRTLNDLIKKTGPMPIQRILNIYLQICAALSQAHQLGIVHRDLKPDNIMLVEQPDGNETAILLDFGIAKMLSQQSEQSRTIMTQAGMFYGTPKYASPEQALEKTLDKRSDIYTLGIILYEALSGEVPFEAPSVMEVLIKQLNQEPVPLSKCKPELKIPQALDDLIIKCLKKKPEDRVQSVEEFLEELKVIMAGRSLKKGLRRGVIGGAVFAVAVASGLFAWSKLPEKTSERSTAVVLPVEKKTEPVQPEKSPVAVTSTTTTDSEAHVEHEEPLRGLVQSLLRGVESDSTKRATPPNDFPPMPEPSAYIVNTEPPAELPTPEIIAQPEDVAVLETKPNELPPTQPTPQIQPPTIPTPVSVQPLPPTDPNVTDSLRKELSKIEAGKKEAAQFYSQGRDLYKQRRYAEAAARFEQAIQFRADATGSYISLGNCYMKLGRSDKALSAFLSAVRIEPSYGPAHYSLAGFYASQGDTTKALDSLRRAIAHDPRAKNFAADDPDLASLRNLPEFKAIVR